MKKVYDFIKSQKLGIIIGFSVTGLLIIGSLIMNFNPYHYSGLSGEDITFFFNHKKPIHTWFYILFFACIIYGINTFFCTLDSVIRKTKGRIKKLPLYGASIVHVGFIVTLIVHLIGGLYSSLTPPISVSEEWTDMGGFEMRVTDLKTTSYPNGMPKKITGYVAVRKDGIEYEDTIGYNNPVVLNNGVQAVLLRDYGNMVSSVVLKVGDRIHNLKANEVFAINGKKTRLADLYLPPQYQYPVVKLVSTLENKETQSIYIPIGEKNAREYFGTKVVFDDIKTVPGLLVTIKNNPSIPLSLVTVFLFSLGTILVVVRMVGRMVNY
ncbi:MAG: cytochrome c biogenesis protein ResB [Candidatus Kuenenia sp.]|nr:cytochrome c biogenesis protein ResB [Candidatus Kuenenia hertensis]